MKVDKKQTAQLEKATNDAYTKRRELQEMVGIKTDKLCKLTEALADTKAAIARLEVSIEAARIEEVKSYMLWKASKTGGWFPSDIEFMLRAEIPGEWIEAQRFTYFMEPTRKEGDDNA